MLREDGWPDVLSLVPPAPLGRGPSGWRSRFPALRHQVNGHPLAYLDSAATTLRPIDVTRALAHFDEHLNANPGRTLHTLARRAYEAGEEARRAVARLISAPDPLEIVFTRGTTEAINLVATAWGGANLRPGDEVLLTVSDHASVMLPCQLAARKAGAEVRYLDVDDEGRLRLEQLDHLLTSRTRLFAFPHVSNVLGLVNPARELCARARQVGAVTLVDGAQSVPHVRVNVQELDCDFLAFSAHKMMGPMGTGVLWGRHELLERMPPYQAGSNMAHDVGLESASYSAAALRFGAGTPNLSGAVGLAAAIRLLDDVGAAAQGEHEQALTRHALERLQEVPGLRILGPATVEDRIPVFSFTMEGKAPMEILSVLDRRGVAIRAGDLAALPLLQRFGIDRAARVSLYLYSTVAEIDRLVEGLQQVASGAEPGRQPGSAAAPPL